MPKRPKTCKIDYIRAKETHKHANEIHKRTKETNKYTKETCKHTKETNANSRKRKVLAHVPDSQMHKARDT